MEIKNVEIKPTDDNAKLGDLNPALKVDIGSFSEINYKMDIKNWVN
jgi:hypothetical protein